LFHAIRIDDDVDIPSMDLITHDFMTGNGYPCCGDEFPVDSTSYICSETLPECSRHYLDSTSINTTGLWQDNTNYIVNDSVIFGGDAKHDYKCIQSHLSNALTTKPTTGSSWESFWEISSELICVDTTAISTFYQRDTYDCGSFHDLGAVTDIRRNGHEHEEIFPSNDDCWTEGVDQPEQTLPPIENDVHLDIQQRIDDRLRCYHCADSTGCVDLGCSDCLDCNDYIISDPNSCSGCYCRFLDYDFENGSQTIERDCIRPPIDTEGYIYSDVIPDSTTGIVHAEIRPGVFTTEFDECYDPYHPNDSTGCEAYDSTNFTYYQTGGFADFDTGGMFDCTHGFDMIQITIQENIAYLVQETGDNLLLDDEITPGVPGPNDGGRIQLEEGNKF
jgi:hypothetical protein